MGSRPTKAFGIAVIALVLLVVSLAAVKLVDSAEQRRVAEQAETERQQVIESYLRVNFAFGFIIADNPEPDRRERVGVYTSPDYRIIRNPFGLDFDTYIVLKYYEKMTGVILEYETAMEYLSKEYEPDGSLRLYDNGKHPEIEAFVDWMWQRWDEQVARHLSNKELKAIAPNWSPGELAELDAYMYALDHIYSVYYFEYRDDGFVLDSFYNLSPQMYDELIKKEADPTYELDLLNLQLQGY